MMGYIGYLKFGQILSMIQVGKNMSSPRRKLFTWRSPSPTKRVLDVDKTSSLFYYLTHLTLITCATYLWLYKRGAENEANIPYRARRPICSQCSGTKERQSFLVRSVRRTCHSTTANIRELPSPSRSIKCRLMQGIPQIPQLYPQLWV